MTAHEIPEAIVEKAAREIAKRVDEDFESNHWAYTVLARAALESAAPFLRAQGMLEAADIADSFGSAEPGSRIRARAAGLEGNA